MIYKNDSELDEATKKLEITSISDENDTDSDSEPEQISGYVIQEP